MKQEIGRVSTSRGGRGGPRRTSSAREAEVARNERRALAYGLAVLVLTTIHHAYGAELYGTPERYHAVIIAAGGFALMGAGFIVSRMPRAGRLRSGGWWTFWTSTALIPVVLFGAVEGVYNHAVKLTLFFAGMPEDGLRRLYPDPTAEVVPNDFLFEFTGVLQAVPAAFAALCLVRLLKARGR